MFLSHNQEGFLQQSRGRLSVLSHRLKWIGWPSLVPGLVLDPRPVPLPRLALLGGARLVSVRDRQTVRGGQFLKRWCSARGKSDGVTFNCLIGGTANRIVHAASDAFCGHIRLAERQLKLSCLEHDQVNHSFSKFTL